MTEDLLQRVYRLLSVRMTDFDCGRLCAPANDGIPCCCDTAHAVPVLYREELRMHRRRSAFWKRFKPRTRAQKQECDSLDPYCVMAVCPGATRCRRALRSVACRSFPFEPHVDDDGDMIGLTFIYRMEETCPLIGLPRGTFNPDFLHNAMLAWTQILNHSELERDAMRQESRALRRRFRKRGRTIEIFR